MRNELNLIANRQFDLLVIGGGITGAGVAHDAASRGLKVALVEKKDFASGTSGISSKLVHGGLRYLEHGQICLVYESLLSSRSVRAAKTSSSLLLRRRRRQMRGSSCQSS